MSEFRVLIVTPPPYRKTSRRDNILRTITEAIGPSQLFLAADIDDATPEKILRAIWHRPGHTAPISLTANPRQRVTVTPQAANSSST